MSTHLNSNALILFQGDSITDCYRNKQVSTDLGQGYVQLISNTLSSSNSTLHFINRGISGNRIPDLVNRWEVDCINLQPDLLSILVGINDTLRHYDSHLKISHNDFYNSYDSLLQRFKTAYPDAPVILLSPFLLPVAESQNLWFENLLPRIEIVKMLADKYHASYIPLQDLFEANISEAYPTHYWAYDGIHPTPEGHQLIANAWLQIFKQLI